MSSVYSLATAVLGLGISLSAQSLSQITLKVEDPFGAPVLAWQVNSFIDKNGRDWGRQFEGASAKLPPGPYTVLVGHQKADMVFEGQVTVKPSPTVYPVALKYVAYEAGVFLTTNIRGQFKTPPGKDAWCRLNGLYIDDKLATPVLPDGSFQFLDAPIGSYSLTCDTQGKIISHRLVDVRSVTSVQEIAAPNTDLALEIIKR